MKLALIWNHLSFLSVFYVTYNNISCTKLRDIVSSEASFFLPRKRRRYSTTKSGNLLNFDTSLYRHYLVISMVSCNFNIYFEIILIKQWENTAYVKPKKNLFSTICRWAQSLKNVSYAVLNHTYNNTKDEYQQPCMFVRRSL